MHRILVSVWFVVALATTAAQVPQAELLKPPANARHFVIQSTGGKHGDSWSWIAADGTRMGRESMNLRGQVFELDSSGKAGSDGLPSALTIRGVTPQGDAAETFTITSGTAGWKSPVDAGSASYSSPAFYVSQGGPIDIDGVVSRGAAGAARQIARPAARRQGARRQADRSRSRRRRGQTDDHALVGHRHRHLAAADLGGREQQVLRASPSGSPGCRRPTPANRRTSRRRRRRQWRRRRRGWSRRWSPCPRDRWRSRVSASSTPTRRGSSTDQTVVVDKGVITAVGARASVAVPAGAQVIDGRGKTLDPGPVGLPHARRRRLHRPAGAVDGRDVGARSRQRRRRGRSTAAAARPRASCCSPHVYPSSLIDGKGPYTAQVANVATSEAEAIALVDKAKANGFTGVKFYGTFNPAWLPASIREAHKLGLHVHGHIPAGIRPMDAINAGYDEITHINWVMMQAMPDSVIPVSNGIMRFEGPGRYAKDVDLEGPAIKTIIGAMASKHIYSDPTMVAFESLYVPENGDLSPSYAPFVGTMPPTTERGFRSGGFAVPKDLTRADYRASWAKMVALLGRMHKAGVPIVAGTDGAGIELVHELEIYVQAGFSPAEALAAATIVPARLVGQDKKTGSIKVGKAADLALVEGDPSTRIGDLRQTRVVMLDGKLLDADALRSAAGFSGRPK